MLNITEKNSHQESLVSSAPIEITLSENGPNNTVLVLQSTEVEKSGGISISQDVSFKTKGFETTKNKDVSLGIISSLLKKYDDFKDSTVYLCKLANIYSLDDDLDNAIKYQKEALELSDDSFIKYTYGEYLLKSNLVNEAKTVFFELSSENYIDASIRLAEIYARSGDILESKKIINHVLSINEDDWRAHLINGTFSLIDNDMSKSIHSYRKVLISKPNLASALTNIAIAYYKNDMPIKALKYLNKANYLDFSNQSALVLISDISTSYNLRLDSARKKLEYYYQYWPELNSISERLGCIYIKQELVTKGISFYRDRLSHNDTTIDRNNLGVLWDSKNKQNSITEYVKAIELAEKDNTFFDDKAAQYALTNLVTTLNKLSKHDEAYKISQKYIDNCPSNSYLGHSVLSKIFSGYVYAKIGKNNVRDALAISLDILTDSSNLLSDTLIVDMCNFITSYYTLAEDDCEKAFTYAAMAVAICDKDNDLPLEEVYISKNNLAFVYIEMDKIDEARNILKKLTKPTKFSSLIKATNALLLLRTDKIDKGISDYRAAISETEHGALRAAMKIKLDFELGNIYIKTGEIEKGKRYLKKVIDTKMSIEPWRIISIKKNAKSLYLE
jgi:tetratricopeptide (TPR) repeat protein